MSATSAYVNSVLGKPYRRGATGPNEYDCYGLARSALACLYGRQLPDRPTRKGWKRVQQPQDGALALMGCGDKHIGVVIGSGVLHALEGHGVVYDDFLSLRYRGFSHLRFYVAG